MSNTDNPLHQFRSYSYHHILIACSSTAVAESVSTINNSTTTNNVGDFNSQVFQHHGVERGVITRPLDNGEYVVVINGARDSEFIISDAKWSTLVIPSVKSVNNETIQATTMATEGSFDILEPKGINFMNKINDVGNALRTGPTGITWVLKTIFIGQTDQGSPRFLTNFKPIMFFMANLMGSFDVGGAEYTFEFIGQSNGAAKIPQFSDLKIPGIAIPKKNTLKYVFQSLITAIQNEYDDYLKETNQADTDARKLEYDIVLEEGVYDSPEYVVDDLLLPNRRTYVFGRSMNIEQAITHLMNKCTKVKADAAANPKYIFKIHSTLNTNDTTAKVVYTVRRYAQPETLVLGDNNINVTTKDNTLTYDYIYTGNNIDIVEFDIKMQMGLAFFQLLEVTKSLQDYQKAQLASGSHDQERVSQNTGTTDSNIDNASTIYSGVTNTDQKDQNLRIIFPSERYKRILQKTAKSGLTAVDFQSAMSQHAELETLESKITIIGNPNLMSDLNVLPSEITAKADPISNTTLMRNWLHVPMFCKINIRMPKSSALTVDVGSTYTEPFWYTGYYTILAVEQIFKHGVFTQELDLLSVPQTTQGEK